MFLRKDLNFCKPTCSLKYQEFALRICWHKCWIFFGMYLVFAHLALFSFDICPSDIFRISSIWYFVYSGISPAIDRTDYDGTYALIVSFSTSDRFACRRKFLFLFLSFWFRFRGIEYIKPGKRPWERG